KCPAKSVYILTICVYISVLWYYNGSVISILNQDIDFRSCAQVRCVNYEQSGTNTGPLYNTLVYGEKFRGISIDRNGLGSSSKKVNYPRKYERRKIKFLKFRE